MTCTDEIRRFGSEGSHSSVLKAMLAVLAVALLAIRSTPSQQPAPVPKAVLTAVGAGVQIYTCTQVDALWQWRLRAPEATLRNAQGEVIGSHSAGPTWQLNDGSKITGTLRTSTPHAGSIPLLVLSVASNNGKGQLAGVTTVQRTDTAGGLAPASGCDADHSGQDARVPYSARYSFYSTP